MLNAFSAPGRFWRGNLHGHSNRSDGMLTPEAVCRRYAAGGYDFTCVTDHLIGQFDYPLTDTTPFRSADFTTLLGAELHSGAMENGELWHVLAVGLPADFQPPDQPDFDAHPGTEPAQSLARRARDAGAFVAMVHPQWFGLTPGDADHLDAAHAIEVYNHASAAYTDRGDGMVLAEMLLNRGRRITLIATDDSHFFLPDCFGGWVMVKAPENTPEALLAALKAGQFYASQGPEIHDIAMVDEGLRIRCSPAERIVVQGAGSLGEARLGEDLTELVMPIGQLARSAWLRVTVIDSKGRRAWSNPLWQ